MPVQLTSQLIVLIVFHKFKYVPLVIIKVEILLKPGSELLVLVLVLLLSSNQTEALADGDVLLFASIPDSFID